MLTLYCWKCVILSYLKIIQTASKASYFCRVESLVLIAPGCWAYSQVPLPSVGVVAASFISLFSLSEVHYKKDVSQSTGFSGWVGMLVVQSGGTGRWQLSSPAAPTFCPGLSRLHLLSTQSKAHRAEVWGIFSVCYCIAICWHLPHSWRVLIH